MINYKSNQSKGATLMTVMGHVELRQKDLRERSMEKGNQPSHSEDTVGSDAM